MSDPDPLICVNCHGPLPLDGGFCPNCGEATPTVISGEDTITPPEPKSEQILGILARRDLAKSLQNNTLGRDPPERNREVAVATRSPNPCHRVTFSVTWRL